MRTLLTLLRTSAAALRLLLALTLVLGVGYPVAVWAAGRLTGDAAEGSPLVDRAGCRVGSALLGVDPQPVPGRPDPYFHTRFAANAGADDPAVAPGDPMASGPSNLGPSNPTLVAQIERRRTVIAAREDVDPAAVPPDALTASGSGLDPDISPAYAALQIPRVARVTGLEPAAVTALVEAHTSGRQFGFLGEPRVSVPELNVALGLTAPGCRTPAR